MSAQLSKLHVRFIQSQKNFYLLREKESKGEKLPITQLYVKDNHHLYLVNQSDLIAEDQNISILFKEATDALNTLECTLSVDDIKKGSEDYEDALLFFNVDTDKVKQVLLLTIQTLNDN